MTDTQPVTRQQPELPLYEDEVATPSVSFVKSFSLFSFFRSSKPSLDKSLLTPLHSLTCTPPPTTQQVSKAIASFNKYLEALRNRLSEPGAVATQYSVELTQVLGGYTKALESAARVAWTGGGFPATPSLVKSLETSLTGVVAIYTYLCGIPDDQVDDVVKEALDHTRKTLLGSPFQVEEGTTHAELTGLFNRPRQLVTNLQTALRPLAHAKSISRGSPPPNLSVTDQDALEVITLLDLFAQQIGTIDKLSGPKLAKTKAQKEEDACRPVRLALEAKVSKCDVVMSMATRDISRIKRRALRDLPNEDLDDVDVKPVVDDDEEGAAIRWEDKAEAALIECLDIATGLVEERRGGVLSNKIERADWLGEELAAPPPVRRSLEQSTGDDDSEDEWDGDDEEESESEDEAIDTFPCPLRSIFRLHDRYEEQRLAVWLSLPTSTRGGMGTYMRGKDGKVGEAWDNLGLLLQLDYDGTTLLNTGLSVDKLDKWIDLASKRNAKKIRRRRGRKSM